jgi:hypothetical protein
MAIVAHLGYLQARQRASALRIIESAVREGDAQAWPYLAVEYLAGIISTRVFVGLAQGEAEKVEARAYVGAKLSLEGDHKAALEHLKWVRKHSLAWTVPFALAVTHMERIKANSSLASKF